jgi:two-component system chemotaxis response regulator CheY
MAFNLLIVDDSRTTRGIIKKTLALTELPLGQILEAGTGREGLAQMKQAWVDLVLADLNMPDMSGVEMIEAMSKDPLLAKLPVVVVSSEGNQTVLDSLAERGVREIVRKPFQPNLLREVMQRVLGTVPKT